MVRSFEDSVSWLALWEKPHGREAGENEDVCFLAARRQSKETVPKRNKGETTYSKPEHTSIIHEDISTRLLC